VQTRLKWVEKASFVAESGSRHAIVVDGSPDIGGRELGARPMELMLMSVGSCSAMDVVHILNRQRQVFSDIVVEVEGDRADTDPKVFTAIRMKFTISGATLDPAKVERAVALSSEKYCSASIMLRRAGVEVSHTVEVLVG